LKILIESLEKRGYNNIIILDNQSTYPPLLEYYKNIKHKVILLDKNYGYLALEKIPLYKKIRKNYFVYTDPDVLPIEDCPNDFLNHFLNILKENINVQKVGFSLKIDDIPPHYKDRDKVIEWESNFYSKKQGNCYVAPIDTTFALHRPYALISTQGGFKMLRTSYPYVAYHMPWYNDSKNLSEEEIYYTQHVEIGTQWSKGIKIENKSFFSRIAYFLKRI
jgi:hypothetical protein